MKLPGQSCRKRFSGGPSAQRFRHCDEFCAHSHRPGTPGGSGIRWRVWAPGLFLKTYSQACWSALCPIRKCLLTFVSLVLILESTKDAYIHVLPHILLQCPTQWSPLTSSTDSNMYKKLVLINTHLLPHHPCTLWFTLTPHENEAWH